MEACRVRITVNGEERIRTVPTSMTLLEFIREEMGLTGTKEGCGKGECGACTVIMDGQAVNSCLIPAFQCNGSKVLTVDGLAPNGVLHPLQKAFIDHGAVQCGFCTPGMIMSAAALLSRNPRPSEAEVRTAIAGNLCRCTGYKKIVEAVLAAAEE